MLDKKKVKKNFMRILRGIRDELTDHLTSINENTNEIQANYEQLLALEMKVDKLNERMDELQLLINTIVGEDMPIIDEYNISTLSKKEKEVYQVLSNLQEKEGKATYHDIAKACGITLTLSVAYLTSIIQKGIPLVKRYVNNTAYISIDEKFRDYQIRTNIVGINEQIGRKVRDVN